MLNWKVMKKDIREFWHGSKYIAAEEYLKLHAGSDVLSLSEEHDIAFPEIKKYFERKSRMINGH